MKQRLTFIEYCKQMLVPYVLLGIGLWSAFNINTISTFFISTFGEEVSLLIAAVAVAFMELFIMIKVEEEKEKKVEHK